MIKIKKIKKSKNSDKLWYSNMEGETFPILMNTKQGYLVKRENESKIYLVKHNHATLLIDDDIV